eukprot:CAMPEP_0180523176 /NCGR_PEP_ID=MMETSP1036_2-20121128/57860_1 /TAXON_ID=632150 /ORGANISM="Azadinium spinosum, Strain 3D9" /LENGTH=37 /DNA_ID= /DNA_START= /DNA_END= /DNA_ORIENTATION=
MTNASGPVVYGSPATVVTVPPQSLGQPMVVVGQVVSA